MTTQTRGPSLTTEHIVEWKRVSPPDHERTAALLEWLCERMGHVGGCGLLNRGPMSGLWAWALGMPRRRLR